MPGVCTLKQDAETQTKPSYFRGHRFSVLGMLIGNALLPFCIPLELRIHQGFQHIELSEKEDKKEETLCTRMVKMAVQWSENAEKPFLLVLDAFFAAGSTFQAAGGNIAVLTRAKKNCVAYKLPKPREKGKRGRPREYGEKVQVYDMFEDPENASTANARIYGKEEEINYTVQNLLWKPTKGMIRFICAITSRGLIVLMTNDLELDPVVGIEAYCLRMRAETMIDRLKNLIGAFSYHFWSTYLPKHSRKPRKNTELKAPAKEDVGKVKETWECYERFACFGAIALGILQILSVKQGDLVWSKFRGFLRTRSRSIPSERTVKEVLAQELTRNFFNVPSEGRMQELQRECDERWRTPKDEFREAA